MLNGGIKLIFGGVGIEQWDESDGGKMSLVFESFARGKAGI